jgi:hypothetical protein
MLLGRAVIPGNRFFLKFKVSDPICLAQPNPPLPQIGHLPKAMLPFGPGILGKRPNSPAQMTSRGDSSSCDRLNWGALNLNLPATL